MARSWAEALAANPEEWLAPFIEGRASLAAITRTIWMQRWLRFCHGSYRESSRMKRRRISRRRRDRVVALDYEAEGGPVLAIRVQELFGLYEHPSVAGGRVPLTLHLLSPAQSRSRSRGICPILEGIVGRREDGDEGPLSPACVA